MDGLGVMFIISDPVFFFIKKPGGFWVRNRILLLILSILKGSTRRLVACCAFSLSFSVWLFYFSLFIWV